MDPQACLDLVYRYLCEKYYEDAQYALADYREWRRKGGFEPFYGDVIADHMQDRLNEYVEDIVATIENDMEGRN